MLYCLLPASFTLAAQEDEGSQIEEVVTIGSQIKVASVTDTLPVTVTDDSFIESSAVSDADELFRYLPSKGAISFGGNGIRSTRGGVNSSRGNVASINLRSLRVGNTLSLINDRRMVAHPTT